MKKLTASDKIYITQSKIPGAGRGVHAKHTIKKGEIFEKCPIIEIPTHDMAILGESTLVTYFFYFGQNKKRSLIALGFGSLYNHSYKPNATYKIKHSKRIIDFIALKQIKKTDEITFNYSHSKPKNKNPLWFETTSPTN